jgi:hypothetical protein
MAVPRHNGSVQDYCDWCSARLTEQDRGKPANQLLGQVDAATCSQCLTSGRVLNPPNSLDARPDVWQTAVVAVYEGDPNALVMLRQAAGYGPEQRGGALISTERLGIPGRESSWFERRGYSQRHLVYRNEPDTPTATCHVQPGPGGEGVMRFSLGASCVSARSSSPGGCTREPPLH